MICVYDSGVGGLTTLLALRKALPDADILYLGDTARVPYGSRSSDTVVKYAASALDCLAAYRPEAVLVACGTVSTVALPTLAPRYPFPIVGVAEAGARAALDAAPNGRIAVLATEATVRSGYFRERITALCERAEVREIACQLFVALAECGFSSEEDPIPALVCERYLAPLFEDPPEAILLGCTHFPWLLPHITRLFPEALTVDAGRAAVSSLCARVEGKGGGRTEYRVTDSPRDFSLRHRALTGAIPAGRVEKVLLE